MMAKILGFLLVATIALSSFDYTNADTSSNHLQFDQELDPVLAEQIANELAANPDAAHDREKRLILLKKIGLKAGLLDFVFGKIDAFIDSKTRFINELDKQNVIKNEKYFGITPPPRNNYKNNLVGTLLTAKKNFIGSALSSIISSKLSHASGSLGFGGLASLSGGSGGSSSSSSHGGAGASFSAGAGLGGASYGGAGAGASATLPGVGSASVGSSVSLPLLDASHGVGIGGAQALYRINAGYL